MDDNTQAQAGGLEQLAAKFGTLSAAERELLKQAPTGDLADCRFGGDDDPRNAGSWESKRQISAKLLAWLCTDKQARKQIHVRGIQVYGADITDPLNLSFVRIPFQLEFHHCRLHEGFDLSRAEVSELDLDGSVVNGLMADRLVVKNHVFLRNGFSARGEVRLVLAQIDGNFECDSGTFVNEGSTAINAYGIRVRGSVFFRKGKTAPWKETPFTAKGRVNLNLAQIEGSLDCSGGVFSNPGDDSLSAYRTTVKSSLMLSDGFRADGNVKLIGAQIGGSFQCDGGNFKDATLELTSVTAATLYDTGVDEPSQTATIWPPGDRDHCLLLDGFIYGRIASPGRINVDKRLDWLARQSRSSFHPQPYMQLAKILEAAGDSDGRLNVLMKMEDLRRGAEDHGPIDHLESFVYRWSVGYGYHPLWAVAEVLGLTAMGWVIYRRSYIAGGIVPTDKDACCEFRKPGALILKHYPSFSPLVYSVENSLPLVKLGQGDKWQPDPEPDCPRPNPSPKLGYRGSWQWRTPKPTVDSERSGGADASPSPAQPSTADPPESTSNASGSEADSAQVSKAERSPISRRRFLARLERALIAVGLQSSTDPNHIPSSLSRVGTSPRFVNRFLCIQILLGWLLATLFVAGISGIVHK